MDSDLAMCALRYLAAVVLVCAPSDVVAYRQNCPSFRGDPVVSHYACAFKYPHHMAAYAEELRKIGVQPSELEAFAKLQDQVRPDAELMQAVGASEQADDAA